MKTATITTIGLSAFFAVTVSALLTGCGKEAGPSGSTTVSTANTPVVQASMTAWAQGDKSKAVRSFVEAKWSARPLWPSDSPLSLNEARFKALSEPERRAKGEEISAQLASFKKLAAAVAESGRDAMSKGDSARARECFTSLKLAGAALDGPDGLLLGQLVGKALKKMADAELAKMPQ